MKDVFYFIGLTLAGQFIKDNLGSLKVSVLIPKVKYFYSIARLGLVPVLLLLLVHCHKIGVFKLSEEQILVLTVTIGALLIINEFKKGGTTQITEEEYNSMK